MKRHLALTTIFLFFLDASIFSKTLWAGELYAVLVAAASERTKDTGYEHVNLEEAIPRMHKALASFATAVGLTMNKNIVMLGQGHVP